MSPAPAAAGPRAALLANPDFRRYFAARLASQLGDQLYLFAVGWFVLDLTRSSLTMAALLGLNSLAFMAAAPFSGLCADRLSRKKVMIGTDLLQAGVLLGLLALRLGGALGLGPLYAGTVLLGLASALFLPAATAIVPSLVGAPNIPAAVAAGQASANLCAILGMLLGGALYRLIGVGGILLLNAASNLLAALLVAGLREAGRPAAAAVAAASQPGPAMPAPAARDRLRSFAAELREGFRQVRADGGTFTLLLINTAFSFAVLPIAMVYIPYLFNVLLGASPLQAAFPQAATWAGIIAGSAAAARLLRRRSARPEKVIAGGLLALAVHTLLMVALLAFRRPLGAGWMSAACTLGNAIAGAAGAFFVVPTYALFHARAREEYRGRFWGLEASLRTAAMCAGFFVAGALAQRLPLEALFSAAAVVLLGLLAWLGIQAGSWGGEPRAARRQARQT